MRDHPLLMQATCSLVLTVLLVGAAHDEIMTHARPCQKLRHFQHHSISAAVQRWQRTHFVPTELISQGKNDPESQ